MENSRYERRLMEVRDEADKHWENMWQELPARELAIAKTYFVVGFMLSRMPEYGDKVSELVRPNIRILDYVKSMAHNPS